MIELNSFVNADCMDYLPQFPDKYFDLAVVDPPYGIGESGAKSITRGKRADFGKKSNSHAKAYAREYRPFEGEDKTSPPKEYFEQLFRISKNQVIFGANHFISKIPFDSSCWIVWDKENDANDFADCELAWTSFKSAVRIFRFKWKGMLQGDMKNKEFRIHPTQKPVVLYDWILTKFRSKILAGGGRAKVIDTHVGSASSLIACYKNGYDYIGFEKDKHYYELANKRLEEHKAQFTIFDYGVERI